jgi:Flp pilus assembly protein CpaB
MPPLPRRLVRRVARHRRLVAAVLAAAAAWSATSAVLAVVAPATAPVVVAVRDLPAGVVLDPADVREVAWPRALVPAGVAGHSEAVGAVLAVPVTRGQPLTGPALSPPGAGAEMPGRVRVIAGLADPWSARLVTPGSVVDLHLPTGAAGDPMAWPEAPRAGPAPGATPLARQARVVQVLGRDGTADDGAGLLPGAPPDPGGHALVVSVTAVEAERLAAVAGQGLAVTVPAAQRG